ncbi:MAG: exo-alpha-sialidase [Alphaproteobacteria bacterium]|nr:exo-alpha-sialidase [Alphaproteobacteria bacterium]
MTKHLYVATRKGLFHIEKNNKNWEVQSVSFLGDPVTSFVFDPRDNNFYAALNLGHFGVKLKRSKDMGKTWDEIASPAFTEHDATEDNPEKNNVEMIWCLETAGHKDSKGTLWAGTISGGLFYSNDHGNSWILNKPLWNLPERKNWFGGGYDKPGIHSILVDPRNTDHIWIGISCGGVYETFDSGKNWTNTSKGMYAQYMPPERKYDGSIQDPHRVVFCQASPDYLWAQHHNGIFRSVDGAKNWIDCSEQAKPSSFGFTTVTHPQNPDYAWFVPGIKDECRVPYNNQLVVTRTKDGGKNFEILNKGLPSSQSYDLIYRHALNIDQTGNYLAMGSTTGNLWITENGGDEWKSISNHLPPINAVYWVN